MTEKHEEEILQVTQQWLTAMFENFDRLHKRGIHDDIVIRTLRKDGLNDVAARYIEWALAVDPDAEEDNTTTSPVVPDPGDAPSYKEMGTVSSLTQELTDAGINADNLEQAIVQTVMEEAQKRRIEHGIFYAEPSVMGGWNVYKKRSKDDNGAYIGHYADENAAIHILESLGTGE